MKSHAQYILSAYSVFQTLSMEQLLLLGNNLSDDPNPIPSFDEDLLIGLCSDVQKIFENEPNILKINGDVIIVGDIHGSLHDLLRILKYIESSDSKVIFLGDYVDRGSFSIECVTLLFSFKCTYPDKYFLLRGNHEFDAMSSQYGFKKEILSHHNPKKIQKSPKKAQKQVKREDDYNFEEEEEETVSQEALCDNYYANHVNINCYKYTENLYNSFMQAFSYMPLSAIVNNSSLCIHGGLSPLFEKINKIDTIKRPINNSDENELLSDLLWADPSFVNAQSYSFNPRGRGKLFNGVAIVNFLKSNNLKRVIRAHECVQQGIDIYFNEKCITVFSASSYNSKPPNKSGILKICQNGDFVEPIIFDPIPRLNKCDAFYYRVEPYCEEKRGNIGFMKSFDRFPEFKHSFMAPQRKTFLKTFESFSEEDIDHIDQIGIQSPHNLENPISGPSNSGIPNTGSPSIGLKLFNLRRTQTLSTGHQNKMIKKPDNLNMKQRSNHLMQVFKSYETGDNAAIQVPGFSINVPKAGRKASFDQSYLPKLSEKY